MSENSSCIPISKPRAICHSLLQCCTESVVNYSSDSSDRACQTTYNNPESIILCFQDPDGLQSHHQINGFLWTFTQLRRTCVHVFLHITDEGYWMAIIWSEKKVSAVWSHYKWSTDFWYIKFHANVCEMMFLHDTPPPPKQPPSPLKQPLMMTKTGPDDARCVVWDHL